VDSWQKKVFDGQCLRVVLNDCSGQREFYVLFDRKDASLVQVGDDVTRLCETLFGNIFVE